MAGDALDLGVALFERELGPSSVIEFCALEPGHRVTRFAGLLKGPLVGVAVAVDASLEAELLSRCMACTVAFGAGKRSVLSVERVTGLRVVHLRGGPTVGGVTGGTDGAKGGVVRVAVTAAALRVLQTLEFAIAVALRTLHGLMRAVEGEGGGRVVKGGTGVAEWGGRRMTANAVVPESARVGVFVARRAVRCQAQIGAALVALGAVSRDRGMTTVERESGLVEMVEVALVQWTDVSVPARVLDVAYDAVFAHVAVKTAFLVDAIGNWLMAAQALLGGNALSRFVTFFAVANALELGVGRAQWTGRQELTDILGCGRSDGRDDSEPRQPAESASQKSPHNAHP